MPRDAPPARPALSSNYAAIKLAHGRGEIGARRSAPSSAAARAEGLKKKEKREGGEKRKGKKKKKGKQPNSRPSSKQPEENQNLLHPKGDEGERAEGVFGNCCTSPVRPSAPEGSGGGSQDRPGPDAAAGTGHRRAPDTRGHRTPAGTDGHRTAAAAPERERCPPGRTQVRPARSASSSCSPPSFLFFFSPSSFPSSD